MKKLNVLSVDDNPQNLKLIEGALSDPFNVLSSDGGEPFLSLVEAFKPDVILLDIMLGHLSGFDLCRELRSYPAYADITVIFVSSLDSLEDKTTAFGAGGDDYICKPIDIHVLEQRLHSLEKHLRYVQSTKNSLEEQVEYASQAAYSSMQQSNELGLLINFFSDTLHLTETNDLYKSVLNFVKNFGSGCSVEFRFAQQQLQLPLNDVSTLESEILSLGRSAKRIVSFGQNLLLNSKYCSLLVKKMPLHDEELCGRLRDHYAILLGIIDSRIILIESQLERTTKRGQAVVQLSLALESGLDRIKQQLTAQEAQAQGIVQKLESSLNISLLSLGLSEEQEEAIMSIVDDTREQFESMVGTSIMIDHEIRQIDQLLGNITD